jgi:type II secretory pathway pseudopilin PulG
MTSTLTIRKQLVGIVAILAAAISLTFAANSADAASQALNASVTATCYSDGYIMISDGGNVQPQAKYLQLQIAYKTSTGWKWQKYAWRSISGSTFRLNTTRGATYWIYATVATQSGSGFTYTSDYVPVTNVKVSPIGAITVDSKTLGFCKT